MSRYRILVAPSLALCALGLAASLLLGYLGGWKAPFDSLAQFRMHFAVLAILAGLLLLTTRLRFLGPVILLVAGFAMSTTPDALPAMGVGRAEAAFPARPQDQASYRLLQMNLRFNNPTPEKVLSLIGRVKPDVITLDEVSGMWDGKLKLIAGAYPYQKLCPYPNGYFGVAIVSRRPFAPGTEPQCYERGSFAVAKVVFGDRAIDVAAIHLGWPWPFWQKWQVLALSQPLNNLADTAIMAGDCNSVPWSASVRKVAELGKLTVMPSVGPTWQYIKLPDVLRFAGLPIDQVFSKGDVTIHSAKRLEDTGSDHLPVLVEFSLKSAPGQPETHESATASLDAAGRPTARSDTFIE